MGALGAICVNLAGIVQGLKNGISDRHRGNITTNTSGKALGGKDGALAPLIKQLTEAALQAEIESHLTQDLAKNRKMVSVLKP